MKLTICMDTDTKCVYVCFFTANMLLSFSFSFCSFFAPSFSSYNCFVIIFSASLLTYAASMIIVKSV